MKTTTIKLNKEIYPVDAVMQTCSLFSEHFVMKVDETKKEILVNAKPRKGVNGQRAGQLSEDFRNALLHQVLRFKIAKDNRKVRELIIEHTLYGSLPRKPDERGSQVQAIPEERKEQPPVEKALEEEEIDKELEAILKEVEAEDYKEDPLQIAVPWEEKHGKKKKAK